MFEGLLVQKNTLKQLEAFTVRPAHALLISGPAGSGKKQLARGLSVKLLDISLDKLPNHPHFFVISKDEKKTEISIDSARDLIRKLSLKVPGRTTDINRIAIIEDAELLSTEAQNALLKLLEEPPPSSLIILTSSASEILLPTVVSRLQKIVILPVSVDQSLEFYGSEFSKTQIESAWRLSRGSASLMDALLHNGEEHQLKAAVEKAKEVVRLKPYTRLAYLQKASKDKVEFSLLLDALSRVLPALHYANIRAGKSATAERLLEARRLVIKTQNSLEQNTNLRLVALSLSLNMPL